MAEQVTAPNLSEQPDGAVPAPSRNEQEERLSYETLQRAVAERLKPSPGDEALLVDFYFDSVEEAHFVTIRAPGDKRNIICEPVNEIHKARFAMQWQNYENNMDQLEGQIDLRECAWVNEAMRDNLRTFGIKTMEQLAGVSDGNLGALGPGARVLRERARQERDTYEKASQFDEMKEEMASMRAQLERLTAIAPPPPNKGRASGQQKRN